MNETGGSEFESVRPRSEAAPDAADDRTPIERAVDDGVAAAGGAEQYIHALQERRAQADFRLRKRGRQSQGSQAVKLRAEIEQYDRMIEQVRTRWRLAEAPAALDAPVAGDSADVSNRSSEPLTGDAAFPAPEATRDDVAAPEGIELGGVNGDPGSIGGEPARPGKETGAEPRQAESSSAAVRPERHRRPERRINEVRDLEQRIGELEQQLGRLAPSDEAAASVQTLLGEHMRRLEHINAEDFLFRYPEARQALDEAITKARQTGQLIFSFPKKVTREFSEHDINDVIWHYTRAAGLPLRRVDVSFRDGNAFARVKQEHPAVRGGGVPREKRTETDVPPVADAPEHRPDWSPTPAAIQETVAGNGGLESFLQGQERRLAYLHKELDNVEPADPRRENLEQSIRIVEARMAAARQHVAPRAESSAVDISNLEEARAAGWTGSDMPARAETPGPADAVPAGSFDDRDLPAGGEQTEAGSGATAPPAVERPARTRRKASRPKPQLARHGGLTGEETNILWNLAHGDSADFAVRFRAGETRKALEASVEKWGPNDSRKWKELAEIARLRAIEMSPLPVVGATPEQPAPKDKPEAAPPASAPKTESAEGPAASRPEIPQESPEPGIPSPPHVEEDAPGHRGDEREPAPPAPPASPGAERPSFHDEATKARLASGSNADRIKVVREFLFEAADKEKAKLATPERMRELIGDALLEKWTKQSLGLDVRLTAQDLAKMKAAGLTPQDRMELIEVAQATREEAINEVLSRGSMKGKVARAAIKNMPYWLAGVHMATVVTNPLVGLGLLGIARVAHYGGGKLKGHREKRSAERKLVENLQKDPAVYAEFQNRILEAMSAQRRRALLREGKFQDEYLKNVDKNPVAAEAEFERVLTAQRWEKMRKIEERLQKLNVPRDLAAQLMDETGRMYEMDQRTVRSERMLDQRLKLGNSSLERLDRVLDRIPVLGARSSVGKVGNFIFFRGLSAIAREAPKFAYSLGGIAGWQGGRGAVELGQYALEDIRKNRRLKAKAGGASPERASSRERLTPAELLANLNASIDDWRRNDANRPQPELVMRLLAETRSRRNEFVRGVDKAAVDRALETVTEMTVLNWTARVTDTVGRLNEEMVAIRKRDIGRDKRLALAKLGGGLAGVALGLAGVRFGRMDNSVTRWVQEHVSAKGHLRATEAAAVDRVIKTLHLEGLVHTSSAEAGVVPGAPHTPDAGAGTPEQTAPPGPSGAEAGSGATAKFGVEDRSMVTGHEPMTHPEAAAAPKPEVSAEQLKLATVAAGSGEGIEHAYIRQLESDPKGYGFQGDPSNEQLVRHWAEVTAHRDAITHGFVTKDGETRVHEGVFVLNKDHTVAVPEAKVYTYSHAEGNVPGTTRVISEQHGGTPESSAAAAHHEVGTPVQPKPPQSQRAVDRFPLTADPDAQVSAFEAQAPIETATVRGPIAEPTAAPSVGAGVPEAGAPETSPAEQPAQTEPHRVEDDDDGDEIPYTGRPPHHAAAASVEHTAEPVAPPHSTEEATAAAIPGEKVEMSVDYVRDLNVQAITDQELVERCSRVPAAALQALALEQHDQFFEHVPDARTTAANTADELRRYAGIERALALQRGDPWQPDEQLTTKGLFTGPEQKLIDGKVHELDATYRGLVRHGGPGGPAAREAFRQLSVWHTLQEAARGTLPSGGTDVPEMKKAA